MEKSNSLISKDLIDAYLKTIYVVASDPEFILNVGKYSESIERLYSIVNVKTACFITSYNPFSNVLNQIDNTARQLQLMDDVRSMQLQFISGHGVSKDTDWIEPSVLILGISSEESKRLAIKHQQNAFIWCDESATSKLVLTH
jgi:hypothetical protein